MSSHKTAADTSTPPSVPEMSRLLEQYGCGPVEFSGTGDALYERHLLFDNVVAPTAVGPRERYEAVARSIRDILSQRWLRTEQTYEHENPKRVYYLSMEFLIGRSLANNILNLLLDPIARRVVDDKGIDWLALLEQEPDAGLGNGGLGRLAACFLDSMATLQLPAVGYGLRYEYGIFKQTIRDGWQHEQPDNWLRRPDPWEVARPQEKVEIGLGCSFEVRGGTLGAVVGQPSSLLGIPFDRPVVGYGGKTINTLRLWGAAAPDFFDFQAFSAGEFVSALAERLAAESLTRVLYPDDSTSMGQGLRFVQEYFLVACSLADLVRRFRRSNSDWSAFPDKIAIQLNDTHPSLAVSELMRILLDEAHLGWDQAWDLTRRTLAYTNHTLLPEALEKWPLRWFELLLPRQLEIILEINRRLIEEVRTRFPGDESRVGRVGLIEEGGERKVRVGRVHMAAHEFIGRPRACPRPVPSAMSSARRKPCSMPSFRPWRCTRQARPQTPPAPACSPRPSAPRRRGRSAWHRACRSRRRIPPRTGRNVSRLYRIGKSPPLCHCLLLIIEHMENRMQKRGSAGK
jgi:starch phosphorylase